MSFVLKQTDSYKWPVSIDIPIDGGKHQRHTFDGEFRRITQSRVREMGQLIDQGELTDVDVRSTMMREQQDALEQDMAPFGFVVTGLEEENIGEMVDEYGTKWNPIVRDYGSNW